MTTTQDIRDDNGMNHDERGRFASGSCGGASHHSAHNNIGTSSRYYDALKGSLRDILTNILTGEHENHDEPINARNGEAKRYGDTNRAHNAYGDGGGYTKTPYHHPSPKPVFRLPNVKAEGPKKQRWRYEDKNGVVHDTRVDTITNQPVSKEFEDAINRLYRGEEIPMEAIERLPEIASEKKLAEAYCTLHEFMHPEEYKDKREKIDSIYSHFSAPTITPTTNEALTDGESYQVKKGKEIWIVTGLPGSGKSTSYVGPISKANNARVVDSDAIKEKLPGFCRGLGAPNVHELSKSINDRILAESLTRGDNIVYPVLGYNANYVGDQIDDFRRKGYKVNLILNELPFSQSLARCLERRLATGRNIPLGMFRKVGDRPSEAYETLKKKVDTYEKYTGDGLTTKCVEQGANKNLPPPQKQERIYSYHGLPLTDVVTYENDAYGNTHFTMPDKSNSTSFSTEFNVKPQARPKYWGKSWIDSFKRGKDTAQDGIVDDQGGNSLFLHIAIPKAFDGEIEGLESAQDLARYHYIAYDCECL